MNDWEKLRQLQPSVQQKERMQPTYQTQRRQIYLLLSFLILTLCSSIIFLFPFSTQQQVNDIKHAYFSPTWSDTVTAQDMPKNSPFYFNQRMITHTSSLQQALTHAQLTEEDFVIRTLLVIALQDGELTYYGVDGTGQFITNLTSQDTFKFVQPITDLLETTKQSALYRLLAMACIFLSFWLFRILTKRLDKKPRFWAATLPQVICLMVLSVITFSWVLYLTTMHQPFSIWLLLGPVLLIATLSIIFRYLAREPVLVIVSVALCNALCVIGIYFFGLSVYL